uniref:Protein FATTY ACID EXPORT 3, chloroplastic n=1 Tax=Kalanchoe fedtschenkoi TaxID=63787 RepID=A0A7N0VC46_KALFE
MSRLALESFSAAGAVTPPVNRSANNLTSLPSPLTFRRSLRQHSLALSSSSSPGSLPLLRYNRRGSFTRPVVVALAASREDSKHSEELGAEKEQGEEGPQVEWKQALASFKEQALKMQSISQEAYETYSKKATVILQETSERLKIQADKASQDLSEILKEISEESQVYLATAAEYSPKPVKEIVETYGSSIEEVSSFVQLQDFHVGIPYGAGLSAGGFLYFVLTGSVSAIRFGVILGGALLALSIHSLRSWKKGGSSPLAIKGQAAIAGILFLRELRLLFQRVSFSTVFATLFSGAMVGTYIYMFVMAGKKPNPEHGTESTDAFRL